MNLTSIGKKSLLPFAVLLAFFPLLNPLGIFTDLRTTSFDTFQTLFPRPALEDDPVVIIDIDDESLNQIGQWPWSRDTLAILTEQTQLAAVTGFDIVFAEPDRTGSKQLQEIYADDEALIKNLQNIVDHDELFAEAINAFPDDVKKSVIILNDACDIKPQRFSDRIANQLISWPWPKSSISSEHKADENDPFVGMASILAKEKRDECIKEISEQLGFSVGSGYPSDPNTKKIIPELLRDTPHPSVRKIK